MPLIPKLNKVFVYTYNHKYSINDIKRFISKIKINKETGCWEYNGFIDSKGYGKFNCTDDAKNWVKEYAHRASYEIFNNVLITEGIHICHSCDNRKCVNPNHLWSGTNKDNMNDRDKKGRVASGENNGMSKLTWIQVKEIRRLSITNKYSLSQLAKIFNISAASICRIVNNQLWKRLNGTTYSC